ncbi:head maturation protease, ClpP-related [Mesobacterium sp. TK19101]|uniref:ATP-dependent Clp protease proteolytic subunit n=1 Tax=Mesobacterium hydrothermale TaxID=3111907 RepID=A0ABU6HJ50_9RHOB|nr:head maturation protease, ClpP-related [Mesobacterium sp. TK19101]MEC3862351.1 head maturation protease, ClpP-related [Mesobacterium sp. TK19101]
MKTWYSICALDEGAEISIYDEIGAYGVSAKAFLADLGKLPDKSPLTLRLNSPGGSVFDAVAIYNALQRHAGNVTVSIDGIAASAASYIAMAGDEIVMPENAFLMIHDPSGLVMGTAADMRAMAEALDKIGASLIKGYAAKSGKAEDEIASLMAAETWFDASEAIDMGLADTLAAPVKMAARFDVSGFRNTPEAIIAAMTAKADPTAVNPDPEPANGSNADPEPDRAAIRTEAMAYAKTVVDLCRLAGQPQMAAGFLEAETDLEDIRKSLIDARAAVDPDISSTHPQPGPAPQAKPWGDVIARTFKRKG